MACHTRVALNLAVGVFTALLLVVPTQAAEPIKIGVLLPYSGVFGGLGKDQTLALEMGFDDFGREVAGRPIELIRADTESKPGSGLAQAKKLILKDKVDMIVGRRSGARLRPQLRHTTHHFECG